MRARFKEYRFAIEDIAFSPDGRSLISPSDGESVRIWNLRDGSSKDLSAIERIKFFISVAFSPDGRYIAGGGFNGSLWIWDSRRYTLVAKWDTECVMCIEFFPDGKSLMSGSNDGTVKCWDMTLLETGSEPQTFSEIRTFTGHTVRLFLGLL